VYSTDYIKRMLEQFGEFLLALKQLLQEDRQEEARARIDLAYREALGLDPAFARDAPDDYLILTATAGRVGDVDKSLVLADLLTVDGDWHQAQGEYDIALQCYCKATNVVTEALLLQPFGTPREHIECIDALADRLDLVDGVPPETRDRLFRYHERIGRFADAEDDLFEMLDADPRNDDLVDRGVEFYERLLRLKDHDLLLGGLPREEVQEGLRHLLDGARAE
jgi:tetratricopeptide (TPR) repeat protein